MIKLANFCFNCELSQEISTSC